MEDESMEDLNFRALERKRIYLNGRKKFWDIQVMENVI